jgi:hypothetical protein
MNPAFQKEFLREYLESKGKIADDEPGIVSLGSDAALFPIPLPCGFP